MKNSQTEKRYRVSYMNTISKTTDLRESIVKTFNTLESATDFVYSVLNEYKNRKLTSLYAGNYEVYRSSIEIEEIITVCIFEKELMIDISELEGK